RQDHRPAFGFIVHKLADLVADKRFQIVGFDFAARRDPADNAPQALSDLLENFAVLFEVDEAARDNVRAFHESAVLPLHGEDHDDHAFFGKIEPVAEHDFFDVA